MKFGFIEAEKEQHDVGVMCRLLKVSRGGYYGWRTRPPSERSKRDTELKKAVRTAHDDSRGTYGSPRVHRVLCDDGEQVGRHRVARLMREEGLLGKPRRRFVVTTHSEHNGNVAPNIVAQDFTVAEPNKVWAGDITYIPTAQGWLYLAVVLDLFSRRVVGWSMAAHTRTQLTLDALQMALSRRQPAPGLLFHSDRGVQYTAEAYQQRLAEHGLRASMSRTGNCYDNAVVESFFRTLKVEGLDSKSLPSRQDAELAVFDYIETFYNRKRIHSHLGYLSPAHYEDRYAA